MEKLKDLINKLEQENKERAQILAHSYNTQNLSIIYNTTESVIKQLKCII